MLRHATLLFVVVAIACTVIVMLPAPLPGHVVSSNDTVRAVPPYPGLGGRPLRNSELTDPAQVFRPDLRWARGVIRSGHLPVWDPFVFAGWPLLASQQAAPLFPVSALSYVLPYEASIAWRILVLLVVAMLGAWLFARRLGLGTVPAAVAALSFGMSAPLVNFSSHPQLDVYALLPWLMLTTDQVASGRRGGVPLLAAVMGLAALGGHPQSLIVVAPLVIAWGVLRVVMQVGDVTAGCRRLVLLGVAVALGLAAAAIVLVPLAELLGVASQTERGGIVGARLSALATLAVPDVWGRPSWGPVYTNPLGLLNYVERNAYRERDAGQICRLLGPDLLAVLAAQAGGSCEAYVERTFKYPAAALRASRVSGDDTRARVFVDGAAKRYVGVVRYGSIWRIVEGWELTQA